MDYMEKQLIINKLQIISKIKAEKVKRAAASVKLYILIRYVVRIHHAKYKIGKQYCRISNS